MRMKIPITGTVIQVKPCILGDDNDPIRPVEINLGDVGWKLIHLDLDAEEMEIEVTPSPVTAYNTGGVDGRGQPNEESRPATQEEKNARIEHARSFSLERMSKETLYALSKSPKLINPFK